MLQKRRAAWMAIVLMFMLSTPVDAWAASSSAMDDSAHPAVKIASFDLRNPQIEMGSAVSGNGSGLRNNDGIYYVVASTTSSPYKAAWAAETRIHVERTSVTKLSLTFDAHYSTPTNDQHISFWNYLTGNWEVVIQAQTKTEDSLETWSTTDPFTIRKFISPNGTVRVRVYNSGRTRFTRYSDWLNVTIEYVPEAVSTSYVPEMIVTEYGTAVADDPQLLAGNDQAYHVLASSASSPYKAAWQATTRIAEDPLKVSALTVTFDGHWSGATNDQHLSLWNWSRSAWEVVRQAPTTTADQTIRWTSVDAKQIQRYIAPDGTIRLRLYNSASAPFTRYSDWCQIDIESGAVGTFVFAHFTDVHQREGEYNEKLAIVIEDLHALQPAFAVNTGDTASYSKSAEFDGYSTQTAELELPVYETAGNHDVRWFAHNGKADFHAKLGPPYQSFDFEGVHFVILDTSVFMENDGAIDPGLLDWLEEDLTGVGPETPIILFGHHPNEDMSMRHALLQVLHPYNVKAFLGGHDHVWQADWVNGILWQITDDVRGAAQYALVEVDPTTIRIYKRNPSADTTTLWHTIPVAARAKTELLVDIVQVDAATASPTVRVLAPQVAARIVRVEARVDGPNYGPWQALEAQDKTTWMGEVDVSGYVPTVVPGQHLVEVRALDEDGLYWYARSEYSVSTPNAETLWTFTTSGAIQAPPTWHDGVLYVGSGDGLIYAIDASSGEERWAFETGGPVISSPAVFAQESGDDLVIAGSQDGNLYALDARTGALVWTYNTGGAVHSNPLVHAGVVYVGSGDCRIHAVLAGDGTPKWTFPVSGLMRQRPTVHGGVLYAVVRDTKVWYAIEVADGSLYWQQNADTGNSYMPITDNAPVIAGGQLWVTKPDYTLSTLDLTTGDITWTETLADEFSARGPVSADGRVFISARSDTVHAFDGTTRALLWSTALREGDADVQHKQVNSALVYDEFDGGRIYRVSERGRITSSRATNGEVVWEYDVVANPDRVFWSTPTVANGVVYVGGLDGKVYAVRGV